MVLTAAQITAFFTDANQMAIQQATLAELENEGISTPDDLADFDKDTIRQVAQNLRNPGGQIPNPDEKKCSGRCNHSATTLCFRSKISEMNPPSLRSYPLL